MGTATLLVRASLRRRWAASLAVAAVLVLGLGAGLTALEAADRTSTAHDRYLRDAEVADVVVNPVLANERSAEILAGLEGVERITSDSLLTAYPDGSRIDADAPESIFVQVRVSGDGRYRDQDRPVVREGRMLRSGAEAFLSEAASRELGFAVGDRMTVRFVGLDPDDPTSVHGGPTIGRETATVVGIGTFADEVLPDEAYPGLRILLTPEVAGPYDCLHGTPRPDDPRTSEELLVALTPEGCAMTYRYWSLELEEGASAPAIVDELGDRFAAENERLPTGMRQEDVGYGLIPSFTADDRRAVRQSLAPAVAALRVFAAGSVLATALVAGILLVRQVRRQRTEGAVLRAMGLGAGDRAAVGAAVPLAAVVAGLVGAVGVAVAASPLGPVASARALQPHPTRDLGLVSWSVALAVLVVLAGVVVVTAWRVSLVTSTERTGERRPSRWRSTGPWPVRLGVGAALTGRDAAATLAGVVGAVAVVTATLVFATGLGRLVDDPDRYGWSFDVALLANFGYGPVDLEAAAADLDRPEVERWGAATMTGFLSIEGASVPTIVGRRGFDALLADDAVVEGRIPSGAAEIALGARTADDLELAVGDEVEVSSFLGEARAVVTGLLALPAIGPFQSDITSLGDGAYLPGPLLEAAYGRAEEATGMSPGELADSQAALIVVDLAEGADRAAALADLDEQVTTWDRTGFALAYPEPVRPPAIIDLTAVERFPWWLSGLFVVAMAVAVTAGLASGTRARQLRPPAAMPFAVGQIHCGWLPSSRPVRTSPSERHVATTWRTRSPVT